jgi:hypothetical protein
MLIVSDRQQPDYRLMYGEFLEFRIKDIPEPSFVRGDANADENTDLSDAVFVLNHLFVGGAPPTCEDAADIDDNETLEITDAVYLLSFLFNGGPEPAAPFPECGRDPIDPTAENNRLSCVAFLPCQSEASSR